MSKTVDTVEATDNLEVPYDTSDKEQVNKVRKKAARTRADRLSFVEAAMTTEQGRAWFWDLLNRCHLFNRSFDPDPYSHAFKAGEVNIGMQIMDDIQTVGGDNYYKMVKEQKTRNT